jgi:thiol:disulfide interchange protein DsbC
LQRKPVVIPSPYLSPRFAALLLAWFLPLAQAADPAPVPAPATAPAPAPVPGAEGGIEQLAPCPATMGSAASLPLAPVPPATAAFLYERLKKRVGPASSICRTPFGLFEVVIDGDFFYVDEHANFLLAGSAFDLRTQENLTAGRKEVVFRIDFKTLPFDMAIKTVRGDGSRVLAVFEDPNCPYCKRFEHDIATLTNATIYTFLYPVLSRDPTAPDDSYPKSKAIWCAPDRTAAWAQLMLEARRLPAAPDSCKPPLDDILALGQKMHITGTPTILFTDGRRAPGAIPIGQVERMIAEANKAQKAQ